MKISTLNPGTQDDQQFEGTIEELIRIATEPYVDYYSRGIQRNVEELEGRCEKYESILAKILEHMIKADALKEEHVKYILGLKNDVEFKE